MVRASAFHVLACRFNPRYCESVRQCSSMVTVLPDQVELSILRNSASAKAAGKDVEDTPKCEVPVTNCCVTFYSAENEFLLQIFSGDLSR